MQLHPNARTTPRSRAELVRRVVVDGWSVPRVAQAFHVSPRTVFKWLARYRAAGIAGLDDRSPAPRSSPQRTSVRRILQIVALRAQRLPGHAIARRLGVPRATVSRILRRQGLGRLPPLTPRAPIRRYERAAPGELLHVDIKSLGRIRGIGHRITGNRHSRPGHWLGARARLHRRRGSRTRKCSRRRPGRTPSASSSGRWRGLPRTESRPNAS